MDTKRRTCTSKWNYVACAQRRASIYGIIFPRWRAAADVFLGSGKIVRQFLLSLFKRITISADIKRYTVPGIIYLLFLSPSLISFKSPFGHSSPAGSRLTKNSNCEIINIYKTLANGIFRVKQQRKDDLFHLEAKNARCNCR